ncbi:nuclear transport factor 2 family protein [Lacinutrix jangbogonensis]|uniref:nuclear transport factor 2 family protein n=1 Tax=Lacinutrix jangbogonensis TaxID=1469557 RepID=UPI00053D02DD|nr:nuclear transport factor 2 family protein [Lacinutrix jangbogonensis]
MKYFVIIFTLFFFGNINAQSEAETQVKQTIETFFEGFHKQDSTIMMSLMHKDLQLQSIGKNKEGVLQLSTTKASDFIKSIVSIPKDQKFEEKILSYNIQIDGNMANAWTAYEFWFNGQFSHCGVNSFQLIKENDTWQIFYLVDTRRREGCGK